MKKKEEYAEYKYIEGESIVFPLLTVEGYDAGPSICITAGIHGCEYPSVASAIALYKKLEPKLLKGKVVIIPVVDMQSFKNKSVFVCPIDKKNVNRCFPGNMDGTYSEVLVYHLFNDFIKGSNYYIDLHSADFAEAMIPFCEIHESANEKVNDISFNMAKYSGISDIVIKSGQGIVNDKNQSYSSAADIGIPGMVLNAGQIDEHIEKYVDMQMTGLFNILKHLKFLNEDTSDCEKYTCYKAPVHIRSKSEGIFYWNCKAGNYVEEGDILGVIEDIFGNELEIVRAPVKGKILLINTAIPIKKDSLLLEIIVEK